MKRPLSVLIKPTSSRCNLNCSYCFYLQKQALYPWKNHPALTLDTFEIFLRQYAEVVGSAWSFAWQGGEPTLMGLPFFQAAVEREAQVAQAVNGTRGTTISNAFQTNGTLLDEDWARFFKEWNFLVGVSLDGPPEWHDVYRQDALNRSSFQRVMNGIEHLRRHEVDFNVLSVVNHVNVQRPRELLHWLVNQGFANLQFIPCVEPRPGHPSVSAGGATDESITPAEYGQFLNELFGAWLELGVQNVRIRLFDNLLQMLWGLPSQICQLAPACGYVVLEHNGDCYPCDFFVETDWKLGNVHDNTLDTMLASETFRRFSQTKHHLNLACKSCKWRTLCYGECPKYRTINVGSADETLPYFCESYQAFYGHSYPRLERTAVAIGRDIGLAVPNGYLNPSQRTRSPAPRLALRQPAIVNSPTPVGRNDPCPCGSGKKYKRCCGESA